MNIAKILVERKLYKEKIDSGEVVQDGKEKLEKGYVPYGAYTFSDLDKIHAVNEFRDKLSEMYYEFVILGENILMDYPESAAEKLISLTKEFTSRMQLLRDKLISGSVALFKGMDNQLYWVGVPTNKFEDRVKDIFADESHRKLVKSLTEGEVKYPDLYVWHKKPAVGEATWVDYDERGFLVAGGVIYKEYEDLVINLISNSDEPIGMSQCMWVKDVERSPEGVITKYTPFEFTFLPHSQACNSLTAFTLE